MSCFYYSQRPCYFFQGIIKTTLLTPTPIYVLFFSYTQLLFLLNCTHSYPTNLLSSKQPCVHPVFLFFSITNSWKDTLHSLILQTFPPVPSLPLFLYLPSQLPEWNSICFLCDVHYLSAVTRIVSSPEDSIWLY